MIYINPPYAEAGDAKQKTGTGRNKPKTATDNSAWERFKPLIGNASNELFAQFFFRVYQDIGGCVLAEFSKLKILQAPNFKDFRKAFQPKLEKMFIVPANTFDNVKGEFPIGFFVWDTKKRGLHTDCVANVYDEEGLLLQQKVVYINDNKKTLANWLSEVKKTKPSGMKLGMMDSGRNDFQHQNLINIQLNIGAESHALVLTLTPTNIVEGLVYFSVRHCIEANWLNDRDQFLYPDEGWKSDNAFQSDCLAFALLHGQNRISAAAGPNHWIPFTEDQVQPREKFASHFMSDFLRGKLPAPQAAEGGKNPREPELPLPHAPLSAAPPAEPYNGTQPVAFTPAAQAVMEAGLALWRHYHQAAAGQPGYDANASYYDIRRHFQGTTTTPAGKERMNNTSPDDRYNQLLANLRHAQRRLAAQIADKVYEYGFLR